MTAAEVAAYIEKLPVKPANDEGFKFGPPQASSILAPGKASS